MIIPRKEKVERRVVGERGWRECLPDETDQGSRIPNIYTTTQLPQQPPALSSLGCPIPGPYPPAWVGALDWMPGRPVCCSCGEGQTTENRWDVWITDLVILPNFTDKVRKGLVNVNALLCRRFDELATEVLCKVTSLWNVNHQWELLIRNERA